MREVRPRIVISNDMLVFERKHPPAPFLQFRVNGRFELFVIAVVKCRVRRIEGSKRLRDVLRYRFGNDRIDREVRIAKRVNIAGSAGRGCRDIHQTNSLRRLDTSGFSNLDLWIACVLQQWRQPTNFELSAAVDQYVRVAQRHNKTCTRIDEVPLVRWFPQNDEVDLLAADFARGLSVSM